MNTAHQEPYYRYRCEARATGKPSHEFDVVDGETARAMCDANGWELIRIYQPGSESDRPPEKPAAGNPPLSPKQKKALNAEARRSYRHLRELGLTDESYDDWRHSQVKARTGRAGLTKCQHSHYRLLMAHFRHLRGAGPAPPHGQQSGEGGDSATRREQLLALLANELGHHHRRVDHPATPAERAASVAANANGGPIGEAYLLTIARAKNSGHAIADTGALLTLPASRLEQLLYTLRNRIAAREGRGETRRRNKSQRRKKK